MFGLALATLLAANAPAPTSNFLEGCVSANAARRATCQFYLRGFQSGLVMGRTIENLGLQRFYCAPDVIPMEDALKAITQYLADHPEKRVDPPEAVYVAAMLRFYRCLDRDR